MADMNAAIKKAQEAAGEIVDAQAEYSPPAQTQAQPAQVVPFQKPSMETLGNTTGINSSVDFWLKVNQHGLQVGTEKPLVTDGLDVTIKMVEEEGFFVKQSIKWGNPVTYASTYDGIVSDKGGSWMDQLTMVKAIAPKSNPFPSADIIMVLNKDLQLKDTLIPAGTKLGHTLSMSNFGGWAEFYREVSAAGKIGEDVSVAVDFEEVNGSNGYTWGVVTFKLA